MMRAAVLLTVLTCSCATGGPRADYDPIEPVNRGVFWFNEQLDAYLLEPAAKGWDAITSHDVQYAFSNFFHNLNFPINLLNNLLQAKFEESLDETSRFVVNTTVGVLGFWDPATEWGIEAHPEDFGQTLGAWGVGPGAYVVIPLFGPRNARDTVGLVGDAVTPGLVYHYAVQALNAVNRRALNLDEIDDAREASLDFYVFVRNAYFQRREALISDSTEMEEEVQEDLYYVIPEDE